MELKLKAEPRAEMGKGPARRARAAGRVPAVLYGPEMETLQLSVDARELWHALHTDAGTNVLIDLQLDGEEYLSMPREVQRDILRGTLLHVDLVRIRRDVAIQVNVPIHPVGESAGVKEGGVLEHHLWELHIEVLPTNVPESIEIDISELQIGDSLRVESAIIPGGVTVLTPAEETILAVVPPPVLELPEEEVAEGEVAEGEEAAEGEGEAAPAEGGESSEEASSEG
ncbi:MAG TPA: 50S ribosomal protein L25 [Actinomycetota bacterium]